jgi:hypothetical protein
MINFGPVVGSKQTLLIPKDPEEECAMLHQYDPRKAADRIRSATSSLNGPGDQAIVTQYLQELETIAREQEVDARRLEGRTLMLSRPLNAR